MQMVKRMDWLDMAKGYGIILVMVGHLCEWTPVGSVIYSFHIPLFFLLSGYLFSIRDSFTDFLKRKAKGMLIPYFALALPMILWDMFVEKGGLHWPYAPMIANGRLLSIDGYGGTFNWNMVRSQRPLDGLLRDLLVSGMSLCIEFPFLSDCTVFEKGVAEATYCCCDCGSRLPLLRLRRQRAPVECGCVRYGIAVFLCRVASPKVWTPRKMAV